MRDYGVTFKLLVWQFYCLLDYQVRINSSISLSEDLRFTLSWQSENDELCCETCCFGWNLGIWTALCDDFTLLLCDAAQGFRVDEATDVPLIQCPLEVRAVIWILFLGDLECLVDFSWRTLWGLERRLTISSRWDTQFVLHRKDGTNYKHW